MAENICTSSVRRSGNEDWKSYEIVNDRIHSRWILTVAESAKTGHFGVNKTKQQILQSYYWPNMDKDITEHLQSCDKCQLTKVGKVQPELLSPLPQCTEPNQRVHADLFGPLKCPNGDKKFILCVTDAFTTFNIEPKDGNIGKWTKIQYVQFYWLSSKILLMYFNCEAGRFIKCLFFVRFGSFIMYEPGHIDTKTRDC